MCHGSQQQNGEAEDHGREVLVHQVVCNGGLEIAVDFPEKDDTGTGGAGEHAVHSQELLFSVIGEQLPADEVNIDVGTDQTCQAHEQQHSPILADDVHSDGGNAGGDHNVIEEVGGAGQQEVVGIVAVDDVSLLQCVQNGFQYRGSQNAQQEVEAIDGGPHTGQQAAQGEHQQVCQHVSHHNQCDLNGELINAFLHGNLVGAFHGFSHHAGTLVQNDLALALEIVQMNDTADGGGKEAHGSHGEAEALAAHKTVIHFIDAAVVHGLSGTLAIAKRQQQSGSFQQIGEIPGADDTDDHTQKGLQKVGGDGGQTGVENFH